jgi:hypothetical protein
MALAVFTARLLLAAILALSAWDQSRDRDRMEGVVAAYGLLPDRFVAGFAFALPLAEAAAALLLLLGNGALALGLFAMFAAAIGTNLARGRRDIDCGCGGPALLTLSPALLVRNLVLLALAVLALVPASGWTESAIAAGQALVILPFYFAANQLLANQAVLA